MKNRDENTTIILYSYRTFTFFEIFFNLLKLKALHKKMAPKEGP